MLLPSWTHSRGPHFNLPLKLTISEKRFADAEKVNGLRYAKQRGDDHYAAKRALQKGPRSLLAHNLLETIQNSLVRVLTGSAGQNLITKESSENFSLFWLEAKLNKDKTRFAEFVGWIPTRQIHRQTEKQDLQTETKHTLRFRFIPVIPPSGLTCRRVLTTSTGLTATAATQPAAQPDTNEW